MKINNAATQVAVASCVSLVIGGLAGYLLAPASASNDISVSARKSCPEADTNNETSQAFDRLTGSGKSVSSHLTEKSAKADSYSYSCSVSVDGKDKLLLLADLRQSGSVGAWKQGLSENGDIGSKDDRATFPVNAKGTGISSPFSAAIYLECKPLGSTLRDTSNLNVEISLLPRKSTSSADRSDLVRLARALAVHVQSAAHRQNPQKIRSK
jgi:hypothetical protein